MDIDARINWMPGMELTAQTFRELYRNLDFRQQVAVRAALGGSRLGLLPGADFSCQGVFVRNTFEVERFRCLAVLPSGNILSADEKFTLPIPMLFGNRYYLAVSLSGDMHHFEVEGVPYVRAQKQYAVLTLEELSQADVMPVARFQAADGVFSVDADYIPPCLLLNADDRLESYGRAYIEKLQALSAHANLEEGEGKRAILHYLFLLRGYQWDGGVREFIQLTQEIAQAIDYYIITPNSSQPVEIPVPSQYDVQLWLQWLLDYLTGAATILDRVVLEDHTIDYEALLAQAKAELYERLHPQLREELLGQIKEELRKELSEQLSSSILSYVKDQLEPSLHDKLQGELDPSLHDLLYAELYEQLYNALYVPTQEEAAFIPMI